MAKTQAESNLDDPKEMFAWMFAAGVPDPRSAAQGKNFPNQPLIPPMCFGALSEMLYEMGARFVPEEQKLWVDKPEGPTRNFSVAKTTDEKPAEPVPVNPDASTDELHAAAAEMVADQFPEVAARVASVTPETHKEALAEQTAKLLDSLDRLKAAKAQMDAQNAAQAVPALAANPS